MDLYDRKAVRENAAENSFDGPYVFYKETTTTITTISGGKCQTVPYEGQPLDVCFDDHPEWNFTVELKKKLTVAPCAWPLPGKLFVVSDIEGEFRAFRRLLVSNEVIDENYNWTFGSGHLVINGDLFDRGTEVTPELWLIYKLEAEAIKYGGYVHTIIGNHDIMNMQGDLRYVDQKYFVHAKLMGREYIQLYDTGTALGRWLRTKNVMEKTGGLLFVHGGISPAVNDLQLSITDINNKCREYYGSPFNQEPQVLQPLYNRDAPCWYRGYFTEPCATMTTVNKTLDLYNCRQIIVGHTIVHGNPALYYNGKVLGIDVDHHRGQHWAVIIENGRCYKTDDQGNRQLIY